MKNPTTGSGPIGLVACLFLLTEVTHSTYIPSRSSGQKPLLVSNPDNARNLTGRFLHITDLHPDSFYKTYSATEAAYACHKGQGPAGYYGAETSDCDSPFSLINATFDWINDNVKDSIDFVIWTGDSARHDNDEDHPRSKEQVISLNRYVAGKFEEVFGVDDEDDNPYNDLSVPIVPTFGNNDILPHNIFDVGPNTWTRTYLDIWRKFVPEAQRHQFDQGGWFSVDVVPGHMVAFSLNSLYFFDKNAATDGCSTKSEPGYRQLEWMRIQLQFLRERGMKAIIMGHVPPARTSSKQNWDESCWQKYTLWQRQYRDVIVANLWGHMNLDHFMFHDFHDIDPTLEDGYGIEDIKTDASDDVEIQSAASYFTELRTSWSDLPKKPKTLKVVDSEAVVDMSDDARPEWEIDALVRKKKKNSEKKERKYLEAIGGEFGESFSISLVSPSVVPNYFPTIRIYEYNITGLDQKTHTMPDLQLDQGSADDVEIEKKKKKKKDKKKKKRKFIVPDGPSKSAPPGPAYSPQPMTLLGYTQYYANLTHINNDFLARLKVDDALSSEQDLGVLGKWKEGKHGKHNGKKPHEDSSPHPKKFKYEVLYNTQEDKIYKLKDMTVRSYLELAERIGKKIGSSSNSASIDDEDVEELATDDEDVDAESKNKKKKKKKKKGDKVNKVWLTFLKRAFSGALPTEEIREQFGLS